MRLNAGTVLLVATKLNEPDSAPIGTFRLKVLEMTVAPRTTGATGGVRVTPPGTGIGSSE
jgi:hypothetical protein